MVKLSKPLWESRSQTEMDPQYQYRFNVFQEVQEISADVADLKAILAKMLAVQEKQQESLAAIAACLEKISKAYGPDYVRSAST